MSPAVPFDDAVTAYFQDGVTAWGEGQLRACDRALSHLPDFAAARFAAAMVFTARQAFASAFAAASAGAAAQSRHGDAKQAPFPAIGLHWLRGLLLLRERQVGLAIESFAREMDELQDDEGYAGEFRVQSQVAAGYAHLAANDASGAVDAFRVALETLPRNGRALVGLYMAVKRTSLASEAEALVPEIEHAIRDLRRSNRDGEAAVVAAAACGARGQLDKGCELLEQLLAAEPAGHAGWQIPIDPSLAPLRGHPRFAGVLARLAARAA
jgi:tetratricopeptide (TPR) repeat protein